MRLIKQESDYSCGIAAIQMITSLSRDTVQNLLGYSPDDLNPINGIPFGMSEIEAVGVLFSVGYAPTLVVTKEHLLNIAVAESSKARVQVSLCIPTSAQLLDLLYGQVALLCTTNHHMLVWDRDIVIDPALSSIRSGTVNNYDISAAIFVHTDSHKRTALH